jgi:hypothetical protein
LVKDYEEVASDSVDAEAHDEYWLDQADLQNHVNVELKYFQ